ncbi:endolysin [Bifidobacterium sp. UTCIF-39]|uniref:CHAP domain-containing protein n=1 Tax=Bifidobacterium sp. UTCIF-39 TaxID=1465359 RepID=UPI00112951E6|nr:CHAP domain-containing protein [Bifidobacterium sp. UTCIF-39]TPF97552.1 endolysin [Bifidobacterium sp. UTCIF-39]
MATANDVLRIAAGEIGYSRWTDPEPGTRYGRWYAQSHGSYFGTSGVPFCAMFASWCLDRAGQSFPGMPAAYVPYILRDGRNAGRQVDTRGAQPGDLVIFQWDSGPVDHIGFVEINRGGYLQTIEGNTNNGSVARRTRSWNVVAAILRPAYDGITGSLSGLTSGQLAVDGSCGPATIGRWQQIMGTPVDCVVTGQVRPSGYARPALQSYAYGGDGSQLILATQRILKNEGFYSGQLDGLAGPKYIDGLHRHLGVATPDMRPWTNWGYGLGQAIQRRLNENRF